MRPKPQYPSAETWLHILFGDDNGGGHLAGQGIEGKTEFPEYWTLSRIECAVLDIQKQALSIEIEKQAVFFDGIVDGVLLRVVFALDRDGGRAVKTAYPLRGNGVFKNINGVRVSLPLLRQDRRK
ncbi:EndoU domain-containing protein [Aurantimicrobium photophilum]|uniref:Uncharacterized protein n=1 Tax=Aurantimicrobium photophilum TaxID=1987356 RepID=A0A2Z3S081_9MICO|nr:EndoU domain-containing protein [Aurantimicrobium photophilum]AWR22335.1 hypothetical protein AURMO_01753 [Aurantimicrobium photophilum]